jgi:cyanophycin synthetase
MPRLERYVAAATAWHKIAKRARRWLGIKKTVYVQERVPFFRELWREAAEAEGFELVPLTDAIWEVRGGGRILARMSNYVVSLDDPVTLDIAGDKVLTYRLLAEAKLTIPQYETFTRESLAKLRGFLERVPGPYVVKPARNTSSGLGVSTHLRTLRDCLGAAGLAFSYCDEAIVEEHVAGESYRLLLLGHELVAAARRTGVRVAGDGVSTLGELLHVRWPRWRDDADVALTLQRQALLPRTVPRAGTTVLVRSAGERDEGAREVRTVYTEDVTDLVCGEIVDEAVRASVALGSEFCGVDIITPDPTVPLASSGGRLSEINTTPGLHHHHGLKSGAAHEPLARRVLRYAAAKRR